MLRAAVIGCGPRGLEHARAIERIDGVQLAAVADCSSAAVAAATREFRTDGFATADQLLDATQPDIVVLATPAMPRGELCRLAAATPSVRAIVLEKPMAVSLSEAVDLVRLCEQAQKRLVVCHQLRHCAEFLNVKQAVERGELGRLEWLRGNCYGNILNQGPHLFDTVCWLAERRPLWVMSQACDDPTVLARFSTGSEGFKPDNDHPAPAAMSHEIAFEDGLRATLHTGLTYQRSSVFTGDWLQKRVLAVGDCGIGEAQTAGYSRILTKETGWREQRGNLATYQAATVQFHAQLVDAIQTGAPHPNDADQSLAGFAALHAAIQSSQRGGLAECRIGPPNDETKGTAVTSADVISASGKGPEISIIIPLPDHRGYAPAAVRSWTQQQTLAGHRFEVIVVADGTEPDVDATVRPLLRPQDRLMIVESDTELELYDAAMRSANSPLLLLTEPHCIAEPACLQEVLEYFAREPFDGACLRSIGGKVNALARMEERLYDEGFQDWSRPGDWRKVILRGFAIKADVYKKLGGFEYHYKRFAEWSFAAAIHHAGYRLGYIPAACVRHYYTTSFATLFPPVWDFTQGECLYRAERHTSYCEKYFGTAAEWSERFGLLNDNSAKTRRIAWSSFLRDGLAGGWRGRRIATAMGRELFKQAVGSVAGSQWRVWIAKLRYHWATVRCHLAAWNDDRMWPRYQKAWDAMVHYARVEYVVNQWQPKEVQPDSAAHLEIAELGDEQVSGFYAVEQSDGRHFRWTAPLATLRLNLAKAEYQIRLETLGIRGQDLDFPWALYWNGRRVPSKAIHVEQARIQWRVAAETIADGGVQELALVCTPLRRTGKERRDLGLPLVSVQCEALSQPESPSAQTQSTLLRPRRRARPLETGNAVAYTGEVSGRE